MNFLEFEKPVEELYKQIEKTKEIAEKTNVDMSSTITELENKIIELRKKITSELTPWERVQLSRHPDRPYTLYYIEQICDTFIELHGDRQVKDDKAMVGGLGTINGQTFMIIGQQKGTNTKQRQYRNFGMANPEGYRKALRLMKTAERFNIPVLTLIDTPGAYPGLEAEERGQGEAIARNLFEMARLSVPIIAVIIGEGASGGAIGIGVGDKVLMLENSWYSVISPESASSILWRSWDYKEKAAEQLRLTAADMSRFKLIDGIIEEPLGGAHVNPEQMANTLKARVLAEYEGLRTLEPKELRRQRIAKFSAMGVVKELA
ncbi:MAG: acetyl-CoA carboxylase carboxyltransferase subunit alpha [Chitinophagales bacterium]|nr:acetyl-CoA carboxylase carboxyltransferase subunit alpha [Chitinophagales bacterium]